MAWPRLTARRSGCSSGASSLSVSNKRYGTVSGTRPGRSAGRIVAAWQAGPTLPRCRALGPGGSPAPLPQKRRRPEPGLSAKLGSRAVAVNTTLWTALCISWGTRGVSLWIGVHAAVELAASPPAVRAMSCGNGVHLLWTAIRPEAIQVNPGIEQAGVGGQCRTRRRCPRPGHRQPG